MPRKTVTKFATYLTILATFAIIGIVLCLTWFPPTTAEPIRLEFFKAFLQILTVIVIGQAAIFFVNQTSYDRQQRDASKAVQREILRNLIRSYVDTKKHRRLLRARAITPGFSGTFSPGTVVLLHPYDQHMLALINTELDLEAVWQELQRSTELLPQQDEVTRLVERMKDYLRDLIHEYERHRATFGAHASLPLATLDPTRKFLCDFLGSAKGSVFKEEFIRSFRKAAQVIEDAISAKEGGSKKPLLRDL